MAYVVEFRPKQTTGIFDPAHESAGKVADNDHNRNNRNNRDGQGPPVGSQAWTCGQCGCFAFYATPSAWHCYECHNEQTF